MSFFRLKAFFKYILLMLNTVVFHKGPYYDTISTKIRLYVFSFFVSLVLAIVLGCIKPE